MGRRGKREERNYAGHMLPVCVAMARYDAGAAAKADDIFMRALLCEGAVSALERYAHAFHDVQLTARISSPKEFHAWDARMLASILRDHFRYLRI